jgi:ferric-dicitrate binding protein FerR (iron transport regulator)
MMARLDREATRAYHRAYYPKWRKRNQEKVRAWNRAWNAAHPNELSAMHLKRRYGISGEDRQQMFDAQEGKCAVCGRSISLVVHGRNHPDMGHVDHDHRTGMVRGLVCRSCNTALAMVRDDPRVARAVACYLEKFPP